MFAAGKSVEAQFVASVLNGGDIATFVRDDNVCRMYRWVARSSGRKGFCTR